MRSESLLKHVQKTLRSVDFGVKYNEDSRFLRYLEKDEEIVFEGRSFVLKCIETGLAEEIEKRGGVIRRKVSSKTDYVVFNPLDETCTPGMKSVFAQMEKGTDIKIVTLLNLLRCFKGQDLSSPKINRFDETWKIEEGILWKCFKKAESGAVIEIPKGVLAVACGAFSEVAIDDDFHLRDVTVVFPDTLLCSNERLGDYFWCSKLVFSKNMLVIPYMGYVNTYLKTVEIPEGVEYIDDYAFEGSDELKTVVLPETLCYLGQHAFARCENLETVVFTPSEKDLSAALKKIPKCCFLDCEKLQYINLPESVTEIHADAFLGCENLKKTDVIRTAVEDAARPLTAEREQRSCAAKVDEKIRKKYIKDGTLCMLLTSLSTAYREIGDTEVRITFGFDELFERINDVFRHEKTFFAAEDAVSCKNPKPLTAEEAEARALSFLSICDRLFDKNILGSVFDFMDREKDSSLTMCSTFVLGALQAVGENGKYLQLVAETTSDFFGYSISVDLKETELTPDTYSAAANSVFLKYLEQNAIVRKPKAKKTKKGKAPATIKISYVDPWDDGKKNSIKVPIIAMEDGRYAIDAEPYKALSDFECLVGNDKGGYEVNLKNPYLHYEVCSDGLSVNVEYLTTMLLHCKNIWPRIKIIEEYVNDKKVWVHDLLGTVFPTTYEEGEIRTNKKHLAFFKKKEYLAEYVYTVLCAVDEIFELSRSSEYAQFLADHAERKKNGTLNRNKCQEIYLPQKVKTVHPVVRMNFRAYNGGDHRISVSFVRIAPTGDIEWENAR